MKRSVSFIVNCLLSVLLVSSAYLTHAQTGSTTNLTWTSTTLSWSVIATEWWGVVKSSTGWLLGINDITLGWFLPKSTYSILNVWSDCKQIQSPTGYNLFIPTRSSIEWSAFKIGAPQVGAILSNCATPPVSFTVTFNGNGGTGHSPASKTVNANTAVGTLPSNPTRSWFTFNGWWTATTGGNQINTATTIIGDITYYARWTAVVVNSCAASPSFTNIWTLSTGSPTSVGQAWSYNATPGNCTYTCVNGYSGTNCATAPAATTYTVTFNGNGGSGHSPASKTVNANTAVGTLPSSPSRSGYAFNGWWTAASAWTQVSTSRVISANTTFYAQWAALPTGFTITFDAWNGWGGHTPTSIVRDPGQALWPLPTNPTRAGWNFQYWADQWDTGCARTRIYATTLANAAIPTYYAYYNYPYTITFNGNGGTGHTPSLTRYAHSCTGVTYAVETIRFSAPSEVTPPTRTWYKFLGWFTAATGWAGPITGLHRPPSISTPETLYAQWEEYKWVIDPWATCTSSCNQSRLVKCTKVSDGTTAGDITCTSIWLPKPASVQDCTGGACVSAVNGSCSTTANTCTAGTASSYAAGSCGGNQTWSCLWSGGGTTASCSKANPACLSCTWPGGLARWDDTVTGCNATIPATTLAHWVTDAWPYINTAAWKGGSIFFTCNNGAFGTASKSCINETGAGYACVKNWNMQVITVRTWFATLAACNANCGNTPGTPSWCMSVDDF